MCLQAESIWNPIHLNEGTNLGNCILKSLLEVVMNVLSEKMMNEADCGMPLQGAMEKAISGVIESATPRYLFIRAVDHGGG